MYLRYGEIAWEAAGSAAPLADAARAITTDVPRDFDGRGIASPAAAAPEPAPRQPLPVVRLHRVELNAITEAQCITHILDELDAGRGGFVVTPNLDHLRRCCADLSFYALISEADLVVADGMPLVWASRLQGTPLPGRVAGSDLIWSLSAQAQKRGRSIFLLGGAPGTADAAARVLLAQYPDLKVVGTHCPPMGFDKSEHEVAAIINMLDKLRPDIVFVALGSPKQEQLVYRIRQILPSSWWLGVGISFSFVSGEVKRAPRWMQQLGLEWVHRLLQEPRRLFRRYIIVGIPFAARLLTSSAIKGIARKIGGERWVEQPSMRRLFRYHRNGNGHAGNGWSNGNGASNGNGSAHGDRRGAVHDTVAGSNGEALSRETITASRSTGLSSVIHAPDLAPVSPISLTTAKIDGGHAGRTLSRLRALVLLGGSVRQTQLTSAIGRSVLDLPVDEDGSILNLWLSHASELARYAGLETLPVRVLVNRNSPEPISGAARYAGSYRVERDRSEFRGTGGVLRDLGHEYDDDDLILVANAAQLLLDPLSVIAAALGHKRGDVALISHQDGTPSGVMLVRCKTLRLIAPTGYVDMKEQALATIASRFEVKVMHVRKPTGLPVRTIGSYIAALRLYHRRRLGKPASNDALAEDWEKVFAIEEDGALVDPRAHVHDSVVLKGAIVEADAAVVRTVVCPGAHVREGSTAVDELLMGAR